MKEQETTHAPAEQGVPLGVLLSEEMPKFEMSGRIPTSSYWTGQADEANRDDDS